MDLDAIFADFGKVIILAKPHWPFLLYMFIFAFVGEVSKRQVFSDANKQAMEKEAAKLWTRGGLFRVLASVILVFVRLPFEYHPMVAGIILGLIPGVPVSKGIGYGVPSALYCMCAGIASLSLYALLHAVFKVWWKYVLRKDDPPPVIELPGEDLDGQP